MEQRPMRRKDRLLSEEETLALLERCEYGVLSTVDAQGMPYGVPLSYVWHNGLIYFHAALKGHKIDNIRARDRVTFTVVDDVQAVYENDFSTYYTSAIVFGTAYEIADQAEKTEVLMALAKKYLPEYMDKADENIRQAFKATLVCAIRPDNISGKAKKKK